MAISTADLFSIETVDALLVQPVWNQSVALSSGLQRLQTASTTVHIPSVAGGSAGWFAELTAIADAGVYASETPVTPKKCAATQVVSNESAGDANAAALIGQALTNALSQTVDSAFFTGGGSNGPAGLPGLTGISTVDGDAAAATALDLYVDAVAAVEAAGGQAGAIFVSPATWAALSKIRDAQDQMVLNPTPTQAGQRSLFGLPVSTSRHVPESTAWVLDPTRVLVVERTPATVDADRSFMFDQDATMLRATLRLEFAAPIPGIVCKIAPAV